MDWFVQIMNFLALTYTDNAEWNFISLIFCPFRLLNFYKVSLSSWNKEKCLIFNVISSEKEAFTGRIRKSVKLC